MTAFFFLSLSYSDNFHEEKKKSCRNVHLNTSFVRSYDTKSGLKFQHNTNFKAPVLVLGRLGNLLYA